MNFDEAKKIIADSAKSFTDKVEAVVTIVNDSGVTPNDLLPCLEIVGLGAEMAATKLHTLTGRPPKTGAIGVYLSREDWEQYLAQS